MQLNFELWRQGAQAERNNNPIRTAASNSRQLINRATGGNVSEDVLLNQAMAAGNAVQAATRIASGGSSPAQRQAILSQNGVASTLQPATMTTISQAVAERRGVITSHNAATLWGTATGGGHAVTVTGVGFDQNGNATNVIINDTGTGQGQRSVPAAQFQNSLRPGRDANVTSNPIW